MWGVDSIVFSVFFRISFSCLHFLISIFDTLGFGRSM